ncbi:unnamed protein product [Penicillium olsonii]|nr:unnamed protein product [Penicillium olsonii]
MASVALLASASRALKPRESAVGSALPPPLQLPPPASHHLGGYLVLDYNKADKELIATRAASSRTPPAPNPRASRPANRPRAEPSGSAAAAASATLLARKFHPHYFTPVPWTSSQANDVGLPGAESSWSSSSCSIGSKTAGRLSEACGLLTSESIA